LTKTAKLWLIAAVVVVVVFGALAGAALLAWPHARLSASDDALARIVLPAFAGRVAAVAVSAPSGGRVPVQLRQGELWPRGKLDAGERLTVKVTVRRPGWAGWLVGRSEQRRFTIETPGASVRDSFLQVKADAPVNVMFDVPVRRISLGGSAARTLSTPRAVVPLSVVASGSHSAGTVKVAAAARSWERLSAPVQVSWFTMRPYPQLLADPRSNAVLAPDQQLTLTFSGPVKDVLGSGRPRIYPTTPGHWRQTDAHTLIFEPSGLGFGMGEAVSVKLPQAVHLAGESGDGLTRTLRWQVPEGSTLRLQQLLAELGYLPFRWQPAADPVPATMQAQTAAAVAPPAGRFSWRYANVPAELHDLWQAGQSNEITRGAVMTFEDTHGLPVDGVAGPKLWAALIGDAVTGTRRTSGYSYVYVHRNVPQSLTLWHNGRVILTSPGNTGVPAAPTQLGTYPVYEHILVGTMSGTNPDGSKYQDPGIRYISYFHGGDALHAFPRASYGTPQSLGCVELPLAAATTVWPYTPIGTLVTIEN
jgi:L,D-transpeptidase catalytic domain/Putative peptidoglycan binding domain